MQILLTGSSGMVGRNVLEHPHAHRFQFLTPSHAELDLSHRDATFDYLHRIKPDLIIHAAGRVGGIQANVAHPVGFLVDNIDINRNLIGGAAAAGIRKLLNLGSSCMFPRNAQNPLREEMVLTGEFEPTNEGYAIAKTMAARLCQYIQKEKPDFLYKTLIPCNLYGRYDKFDPAQSHLIPAVIRKIHLAKVEGRDIVDIWGDGTARREFMDASDLADLIFVAIDRFQDLPDTMNAGLGFDFSIRDYYERAAEVIGYQGRFEFDLTKPVGMKQKLVAVERLRTFGWQAKISLKDGLKKAYEFYLQKGSVE
jgi:GDP-L-fucose synthase